MPFVGNRRRNFLDDLYEQCSDHSAPTMSCSTSFAFRFSFSSRCFSSCSVRTPIQTIAFCCIFRCDVRD